MLPRFSGPDFDACEELLRHGSKSFFAASQLLPSRLRRPAAAVYGFCRVADDAVDLGERPEEALGQLEERLDGIYRNAPQAFPTDRALAVIVAEYRLPREAFEGLLEGFRWDLDQRRYETLDDLREYCVRVAGTVGVLMAALMGERRPEVIARACDLGVAMQLTNIARDVGEDAREGRLYLPTAWLAQAGLASVEEGGLSEYSPELGGVVRRLLNEADRLYRRAEDGIRQLPIDCRPAIWAARRIYDDIGRVIVRRGYDSVTGRAVTRPARKLWLLAGAVAATPRWPGPATREPGLAEAQFLLDAFAPSSLPA